MTIDKFLHPLRKLKENLVEHFRKAQNTLYYMHVGEGICKKKLSTDFCTSLTDNVSHLSTCFSPDYNLALSEK